LIPVAAENKPAQLTASSDTASRRPHSGRRLYFLGLVFIAITIAAASFAAWQLHRDRITDEMQVTKNLAVVLAAQTARSVQAVDLVLREVARLAKTANVVDPDQFRERMATEEVHRFLKDRLRSLPQADAISLIDDTGRIINFSRSWPVPVIDTSDRDFYDHWRGHNDGSAFIGAPVVNKVTGAWVLTITRRVNGPYGEFLGIVLGVVEIRYFEDFYQAIRTNEGESVSLFRQDGTILARHPHLEEVIGTKISRESPWYTAIASGGGTYRTPGYVGGVPRIISVQPVPEYPLAITVGITEAVALAPWRHQSLTIVIGTLGAIIGFAILFRGLAKQFLRLEERSSALAWSEDRFRGFAMTSSDWLWETDEHHRISYMSEGVSTTGFGIKPRDLVGRTRMEIAADAGSELDRWKEHYDLLQRHEPFRDFNYTWVNPGGQGTASISGDPLFDAEGRFLGYRGTGRDITETIDALHRAERAEALLRDAVESISEAFVIYDADDRFVLSNRAYRQLYPKNAGIIKPGMRFEELLRNGLAQQQYAAAIGREEEWLADRMGHHRNPSGPIETMFSNGRCWLVNEQRMRNGGYAGLCVDITKLKETEAQLRKTLVHFDRIQRIAGIGSTTEDLSTGTYTWSPGACAIFGIDSDIAEPTAEYMRSFYHPDDRVKVANAAEQARLLGVPSPPLEYRIIRPDGEVRTVYRENDVELDSEGRPIRRIVTFKDITDLKTTEAQLRQIQDDLNRAQRLAQAGSVVWDLRSGHATWSDETYRIFGVNPDKFIPTNENFLNLVVPEDRPNQLARRQELLQGKCPAACEFSIRRPDGDVRRIYSEAELVLDENGRPVRWVGMHQDITAQRSTEHSLREAKEAAEAASLAKSQFLANISHELRTPLNAIIGFSEMVEQGFAGPVRPKQQEYMGLVLQSGRHLLNVINDILDLAHADSGKFELCEEKGVDIQDIIATCVALMKHRADAGALLLSTAIDDHLPLIVADPTRLKQILLNLMSNAIRFTQSGGSVVTAARRTADGGMAIDVRDTGVGMTPEEIETAWELFGQVDARLARAHEGTGLGLPLARRLTELHGGFLRIQSEKGRGTTVTVTLPATRVLSQVAGLIGKANSRSLVAEEETL
jgi:PAS domain S-box-containing protein